MSTVKTISRYALIGIVLIVAVLAMAVGYVGLSESGRNQLARIISDVASIENRTVSVEGIHGLLGGNLRVERVSVGDRQGEYATLRDVQVDWSPVSLLARTFSASRVAVGRIDVARAPLSSENPQPASSEPYSLPVAVDIDRFEFLQIALGEALVGEDTALSLTGAANVSRDLGTVSLESSLNRLGGVAGRLDAIVGFDAATQELAVNINGSEPADGVVARLLGLPAQSPVELNVTGGGPANNWTGRARFNVDGQALAAIDLTHAFQSGIRSVTAQGNGSFDRFLPENFRALLEGESTLDLAASQNTDGGFSIERANLVSSAIALNAQGAYDPSAASDVNVSVTARNGSVPVAFGEGEGATRLDIGNIALRVSGTGEAPSLDVRAQLAGFSAAGIVSGAQTNATLTSPAFNLAERSGSFDLTLDGQNFTSNNATLVPLLEGEMRLRGQGNLAGNALTLESAQLGNAVVTISANGDVALDTAAVTMALTGDVAGRALPEAARGPLGETANLSLNFARSAQGAIQVSDLALESTGLNARGNVGLNDGALDLDLSGTLSDLALVSPQARGTISFTTALEGALDAPQFTLDVTGDSIETGGRAIEGLQLSATGVASAAAPSANVTLSGNVAGEALRGSAVLSSENGASRLQELLVELGQNRISGALDLDSSFTPEGELQFQLPNIDPLAALALQTVEGSANGTARFAREAGTPEIVVDATIPQLRRQDLTLRNGTASLVVQNYREAPSISGNMRAGEIVQGANRLKNTDLILESSGNRTGFTVTSRFNGGPANIRGALTTGQAMQIALDAVNVTFQNIPIALQRPAQITIENGVTRIAETALGIGGGAVVVSGSVAEQLNINARINAVPATIINQFAQGLGAQGEVKGNGRVTGATSNPTVNYDVTWTGASLAQTQSLGVSAMNLSARGRYAGGQVNLDAFGAQNPQGLSLNGSGTVGVANGGGLGLTINGQAPFALASGLLAQQGVSLTGGADIALRIGGTTANPDISGTVRSNGGRLVLAASGLAINNVTIAIDLGGNTARISTLSGQLSSGGSISGSGTVGIATGSGYPADLRVVLNDARYTDGRLVTTNLGGEITLNGQLTASPDIGGTINLGRTVVTIPERLPSSLTRLNVQHRDAPADVERQRRALTPITSGGQSGSGIGLNITINAPQQIFIRGRGLDAELGGNIVLSGNTAAPETQGQFELRRGRLEILGKRLTFTEGTMTFAGSYIPYLDMRAESQATDTTVTVLVTGPADNPKFGFESVPALPEDEVLARLIFGREMSSLSPVQIARLAAAAAELAGVGGGSALLSTLEDSIGVDDIDVESTADGGTSVRAGKYLNERTYVTIEKGDAAGSGKATINLDLGRGLKVRGQASDDGDAGGGVFYEREY